MEIEPGDRVLHCPGKGGISHHGIGTILHEWGSWRACKMCYRPYCDRHRELYPMNKNGERQWFYDVNGEGTFDVLFDGEKELRSVNQRWLKRIVRAPIATLPEHRPAA